MATEILRPQDCLRPHSFYDPFTPKPFTNRRKSRSVRTNQTTPSPNPKQGRPNPKSNRKSSPSPSTSPLSTSPPSTPLSTSPVQEGFKLLKRGEAFRPGQHGSEKVSPVKSKRLAKKHELGQGRPEPETLLIEKVPLFWRSEPELSTRVEKTPPQKKNQFNRSRPGPELATLLTKPARVGLYKDSTFAGPNYACCAPEASCLPQPGLSLLLRSSSVGHTSDDEASRTLRSLLKL